MPEWKQLNPNTWVANFDNFSATLARNTDIGREAWVIHAAHLHGGLTHFLAPCLDEAKHKAFRLMLKRAKVLKLQWASVIKELELELETRSYARMETGG